MTSETDEESFYLEYKPKYKIFHELMAKRVKNVLLVSSIYDSFMLEEDGRLSDQVYEAFQNLHLRTLPRITRVSSATEALAIMKEKQFDLVITMRRLGEMDAFSFGRNIKQIQNIPVILLLTSVVEIKYLPDRSKRDGIDRIFVWNGDSKIFVAIIKHLEDKFNVDYDTKNGLVRLFIFVEDSIRFYSLLLPELYSEIMRQTHRLITEGANDFQDLLQMRARPKILLAETYEEAMDYYQKYKDYVMGIISDIEFPRKGKLDKEAGFSLVEEIGAKAVNLPVVLQSSKLEYEQRAEEEGCFFIHKKSHGLLWDLHQWLLKYVGFGNFLFKLPDGNIVGQAKDIIDFYHQIRKVPIESIIFHGQNDHFSNWLMARGEFEIAQKLKPRKVSEFTRGELRAFLLQTINEIVVEKTRGIINDFNRESYHPEMLFLRLRPGSLGGKGRGLAFLMFLLNSFLLEAEFPNVSLRIPKTIVIGTDAFDNFMEKNNLYEFALSDVLDEKIKEKFVAAKLSNSLRSDLEFILVDLNKPLAVRSSSLLEDSAYQPFAGIFSTYMIPNNDPDLEKRLEQLCTAIKLVYASSFFKRAKSYAETIGQTIEEAKMAIVIQTVIGREYNNRFYPAFSGTASSHNYYPIGETMKPEDRIAHIALGLGRIIVEGGESVRFCPKYPKINYYATPDQLLDSSQKDYYAIDLNRQSFDISREDPFLVKLDLDDAIEDGTLLEIADTYEYESCVLRTGYRGEGAPVITFSKQLKLGTFPLPKLLSRLLTLGEKTMGCSIEIEFAGNFKRKGIEEKATFYILQIRPFLQQEEPLTGDLEDIEPKSIIVRTPQASGNLLRKDIRDVVYVKPEKFEKLRTLQIVEEIDQMNRQLFKDKIPYILIGFGRWGTADRFLGIPVKWNNISGVKVLIEASLKDFQVDFSQGSHFFQNIVSSNIGYFYIKYGSDQFLLDWEWLQRQKVINETEYIRHIRTKEPLIVRIDGKKREGIIIKPKE